MRGRSAGTAGCPSPLVCLRRVVVLLLLLLGGSSSLLRPTQAYPCVSNADCALHIAPGSQCRSSTGHCSNPFANGGCLAQRMPRSDHSDNDTDNDGRRRRPRVCHSEDPPEALLQGHCRLSAYPHELRLGGGNWESSLMGAWILQILASEFLGVAATVESGSFSGRLDGRGLGLRRRLRVGGSAAGGHGGDGLSRRGVP
jgi:hypothetical protein